MMSFNLYFGTQDGSLKLRYRYTKKYKSELECQKDLQKIVTNFYYKHEGTHHLPSYKDIEQESKITNLSIERLYNEHIDDLIRSYYIPTEVDTISTKDLIRI